MAKQFSRWIGTALLLDGVMSVVMTG